MSLVCDPTDVERPQYERLLHDCLWQSYELEVSLLYGSAGAVSVADAVDVLAAAVGATDWR